MCTFPPSERTDKECRFYRERVPWTYVSRVTALTLMSSRSKAITRLTQAFYSRVTPESSIQIAREHALKMQIFAIETAAAVFPYGEEIQPK